MSLIILSSAQEEYSSYFEGLRTNIPTGLQRPYHFRNHLSNSIRIPPHSEVAVHSVKIDRLSTFQLRDTLQFFMYWGEALTTTKSLSETSGNPVPVSIRSGLFTRSQMKTELQLAINRSLTDPQWFNSCVITDAIAETSAGTAITVPNYSAGGFGYTFSANTGQTNVLVTDNYLENAVDGLDVGLTWTKGSSELARDGAFTPKDGTGVAIMKEFPISRINSTFVVDFSDLSGVVASQPQYFAIGFTRPVDSTNFCPSYFTEGQYFGDVQSAETFYDYVVDFTRTTNEGTHYVRCHQACWANDSIPPFGQSLTMREVKYYDNTDGVQSGAIIDSSNMFGLGNACIKMKWTFIGEQIRVELLDEYDTPQYVLIDSSLTNELATTFKPQGLTTQALYPKFNLAVADTKKVTLESFNTDLLATQGDSASGGYKYIDRSGVPVVGGSFIGRTYFSDWWNKLARYVDSRPCMNVDDGTAKTYMALDTTGECVEYVNGLILTPTRGTFNARADVPNSYWNSGTGTGGVLGFNSETQLQLRQGVSTKVSGVQANDDVAVWTINSSNIPNYAANSLFVACPTLTQQSYNFCKGLPSKILYHCPQFSNSGNQFGKLHFEASERVYLDLKNPNEIIINDLEIQMVDKNDRIVKDLGGTTTIVLHVRQKN